MASTDSKVAGLLLFLATVQFSVGLMIAAARYPDYSIADNYISDLGVGSAAIIFNSSIIALGIFIAVAAFFIHRVFSNWALTALLVVAGVGAAGVGVFPENVPTLHTLFAFVAFVFGGLAALVTVAFVRSPLRYLSLVLGVISLAALGLFATGYYLGLGVGGMERMIVLPILGWGMAFGGYLMADES